MGCGASAARFISPLELAIRNEDTAQVINLLHTGSSFNKPLGPRPDDDTPLVMATQVCNFKRAERMLDLFGDVITQEHLNEALCAAVSALRVPLNVELVVMFLHHGAHLVSPLKLSRSLKAVGLQDSKQMEFLIESLCKSSKHSSVHGGLLCSLCNSSIQVRAKLSEDLLLNPYTETLVKKLFQEGVAPESYWSTSFTDLCLQEVEVRPFKPACVTKVFIQAAQRPNTLSRILDASTIFTKPCDDVLLYLHLLLLAGYFTTSSHRLSPQQLRKLIMLNTSRCVCAGDLQFESFPEYFDFIYRNPRNLVTLCVQVVRKSIGASNVFHGLQLLEKEIVLPFSIKQLLLLELS